MISDEKDDWKASFRYEMKCCLFGFLYGALSTVSLIMMFVADEIVVYIYPMLLIYILLLNIRSMKFSIKELLIEIPITVGSFFFTYIMISLLLYIPVISID